MSIFRKFLKLVLGFLARWAIKKHQIELIVVTGFYGSEIVKEGIYEIFNQKYKVRRNTDQILWDMSLPLAVLGYKDRRRNFFEWLVLMARATFYLLVGPKNNHTLILNANCTYDETAKFWASFLKPDYLVILNEEKDSAIINSLLENLKPEKSVLIYEKDKVDEAKLKKIEIDHKFTFAAKGADLNYNQSKHTISYKSEELKIPSLLPSVIVPHIAAVFALCVNHGFSLDEAGLEALKFDLESILTKKIQQNLGKEGSN